MNLAPKQVLEGLRLLGPGVHRRQALVFIRVHSWF